MTLCTCYSLGIPQNIADSLDAPKLTWKGEKTSPVGLPSLGFELQISALCFQVIHLLSLSLCHLQMELNIET